MPVSQQTEKLYGPPGPQNSAVLMDIITKLKQELQQSRADNHKLVDQLNCLISLVKRAWSGEQGAMLHLSNIVGMEPPSFNTQEINRNTPVMDKTQAVKNWERLAVKLLERNYAAVQEEIRERQRLHIQNRQLYMNDVLEDHKQEMSKFNLHRNSASNIEDVDKQFIRCYSAKSQGKGERRVRSAYRPRSGFRGQMSRAADMVERSEVTVEDLLGQEGSQGHGIGRGDANTNTNAVMHGLYKLDPGMQQKNPYRPRETFDDVNRYKQSNLFDPDVIFSPEMLVPQRGESKGRPSSAADSQTVARVSIRNRPSSAVFLTEGKPERPLKYETTRPISGSKQRPGSGTRSLKERRHSAPTRRPSHPSTINRKELHNRNGLDHNYEPANDASHQSEAQSPENYMNDDHVTNNHHDDPEGAAAEKPPMKVKVKTGHPMDKFVEELKLASAMEEEFKRSAIQLQKKLGLETSGFVY